MCIPNKMLVRTFPGLICRQDDLPHFTLDFQRDAKDDEFIVSREVKIEKMYHANVHFSYNEAGDVVSIDVCLIAPAEENDPDEPIPYVVTDLGQEAVKTFKSIGKEPPNAYVELDW